MLIERTSGEADFTDQVLNANILYLKASCQQDLSLGWGQLTVPNAASIEPQY